MSLDHILCDMCSRNVRPNEVLGHVGLHQAQLVSLLDRAQEAFNGATSNGDTAYIDAGVHTNGSEPRENTGCQYSDPRYRQNKCDRRHARRRDRTYNWASGQRSDGDDSNKERRKREASEIHASIRLRFMLKGRAQRKMVSDCLFAALMLIPS